jgi:hypothetical protein
MERRCLFCGELLSGPVLADKETADLGLGQQLCARPSCREERARTPVSVRRLIYEAIELDAWRR